MILNASGCLDALTAPSVARSLDVFVTKTVTPFPRAGNAPTRIAETDAGMLNSIGLANPGIDAFCAQTLPRLRELGVPLWVSVGGFAASDYADLCARLDGEAGIAALELNVSCPNVSSPVDATDEIVRAARAALTISSVASTGEETFGHETFSSSAATPASPSRRAQSSA